MLYVLLVIQALALPVQHRKGTFMYAKKHGESPKQGSVVATVQKSAEKLKGLKQTLEQAPGSLDHWVFDDVIDRVRNDNGQAIRHELEEMEMTMRQKGAAMGECNNMLGYRPNGPSQTYQEHQMAMDAYVAAQNEYTGAHQQLVVSCQESHETCLSRDTAGLGLYHEVAGSPNCEMPLQPDPAMAFDESFPLAQAAEWAGVISNKHQIWDMAKGACAQAEVHCSTAEAHTASVEMHMAANCGAVSSARAEGKHQYDTCWDQAAGEMAGFRESLEHVEGWQVSAKQLETLICYIRVGAKHLETDSNAPLPQIDLTCVEADEQTYSYICTCMSAGQQYYAQGFDFRLFRTEEYTAPTRDVHWDDVDDCHVGDLAPAAIASPVVATTASPAYAGTGMVR